MGDAPLERGYSAVLSAAVPAQQVAASTAVTLVPVPRRPLSCPARALRLEIKRSAVPWVLPLLAAVFYFDALRTADGFPPVWAQPAAVIPDHMSWDFGAVRGRARRLGRRPARAAGRPCDLVGDHAARGLGAAVRRARRTLCWVLLAFLAGVAVIYVQTALQAAWGGPPLWPVLVGVACVTVVTVVGFAAGRVLPRAVHRAARRDRRVPAPSSGRRPRRQQLRLHPRGRHLRAAFAGQGAAALVDAGTYYHVAPDVSIVQVMFMAGIAVALFGVLGLAPAARLRLRGGRRRCAPCSPAVTAGWSARSRLADRLRRGGVRGRVLAGRDGAAGRGDRRVRSRRCTPRPPTSRFLMPPTAPGSAFQVCVHPAFGFYLHRSPRNSTRWPPRSPGCPGRRSGPSWRSGERCPAPRARTSVYACSGTPPTRGRLLRPVPRLRPGGLATGSPAGASRF